MPARTFSTDRELKALKPSEKHFDVKDEKARNLIVRVGPENSKGDFRRTFCLVTRFPGSNNPTRHAFGEYKVNGKGDKTVALAVCVRLLIGLLFGPYSHLQPNVGSDYARRQK